MLTRVGPGSYGYNFQPEFIDVDCVVTLAAAATCVKGQVLKRDLTAIPGTLGADQVLLPNAANAGGATAGAVYGVYQGPSFTNAATTPVQFPITVRTWGQGVVNATAGANLLIGNPVITANTLTAQGGAAGAVAAGAEVGIALATGAITAPGAALSTGLVNVAINVQ